METSGCIIVHRLCVDAVLQRCADIIACFSVKFYIGICAEPVTRAFAPAFGHAWNYDVMQILSFGDSDHIVDLEVRLIQRFKENQHLCNRKGGGGGRCPSGALEFLYVCKLASII